MFLSRSYVCDIFKVAKICAVEILAFLCDVENLVEMVFVGNIFFTKDLLSHNFDEEENFLRMENDICSRKF